ncbi:MAG: tetratricopeptide repeat protein [Bryobacteraceae bacterium]|jgi:Tfp pilus assembly protein PilF
MAGASPRAILLPGLLMALAARASGGVEARKSTAPSPPVARAAAITIDYPEEESIFPPEITPPTFLWTDSGKGVTFWRIEIAFGDGAATIHAISKGERPRVGRIDPDCVADTNDPPKLTPRLAAAHSWAPDLVTWQAIKRHSVTSGAMVTITGFRDGVPNQPVSRGKVILRTSKDKLDTPIFYRDVPLMPSELERGVIKPLAAEAIPLVAWRIRNVGEARSRLVMENLPLCANCHSFSADGKTMGMDLDGLQGNRGMYILAPVAPQMAIRKQDVIQWSSAAGKLKGSVRIGFMSQVSPDGQYVVTTINPAAMAASSAEPPSNYYVANFKDYRYLQVFYPTRGILSWYSRQTGVLQPLPGADDPRFVQMGAVWSPDGESLVFARAEATDPNPPGVPLAKFANDPNELQLRYDLYRVPFRQGHGGVPEPIAGASRNGMSNTFPKVSPDGRWIVFVECRNGELMRPDSRLYIVPAGGGRARRMRCNMPEMNSWHSFSPSGRWLVFSSKSRSPYTQMYLTHIDSDGNDSPAILIENATAANRAVNIPEFVNVPPDGLRQIGGPVVDYYRLVNTAMYLQKTGSYQESAVKWRQVLELSPDDEVAHRSLATVLLMTGHREESAVHFQRASEIKLRAAVEADPASARGFNDLGVLLAQTGRVEEAVTQFEKAARLKPDYAAALANLGGALVKVGRLDEALVQLTKALESDAKSAPAHYNLGLVLSQRGDVRGATREWGSALDLDPKYAEAHDRLGDALYAQGRTAEALTHWRDSIQLQPNNAPTLRRAAWVLATSPDASIRNGDEALRLAVRAIEVSGGNDARMLDTLAAAYAERGQFADAAATARRALARAEQANQPALAAEIGIRVALYEAGQAFRDRASPPVEP